MIPFVKKLRNKSGKKPSFTLIEVLMAASIFTIVSLIGVTVFVNVIRIQRRVALENAIYEDARFMMERISREIRSNTIDYEEYYNKALTFEPVLPNIDGKNPYGNRYGCYAKRFYNPGTGGPELGDFGAYCNDDISDANLPAYADCVIDKTTLDINTGQNPYTGSLYPNKAPGDASAFCDKNFSSAPTCTPSTSSYNRQSELYLINAAGTQKTILAEKEISSVTPTEPAEHALGLLRLTGQDSDHDGIVETWRNCIDADTLKINPFCCSDGFLCPGDPSTTSLESTLKYNADLYLGFIPISPTRTDVKSLYFYVAPLEDPRKAFAETDTVQQQPHVTVVLTVVPTRDALAGYTGDLPVITIQTTVTSRVYNEVKSYYRVPEGHGVCAVP